MKVAVSALGPTADDSVDEHFGRAAYFVVVETETGSVEVLDNSENARALQGAGLGAAEVVANAGIEAVITGHLGPKAYDALEAVGIAGYSGVGLSVREAVELFARGRLERLDDSVAHQRFE